jgi:hypothetical protein
MVEPEKSGEGDQHAIEAADCVGWLVRLEITRSRARHEDPAAEVDAANVSDLDDVLRLIKGDFRQFTVPLLGRPERVLPARSFFRLRKILARWRDLLGEKTGDTSLFRVSIQFEQSASASESRPERCSELIDEGSTRERQIEVRILNVGGEAVSSRALLGRFHPEHKEPIGS